MIVNIRNISRSMFHRINFADPTPLKEEGVLDAYISIHGTEDYERIPPKINLPLWDAGIQIQFDDVDKDDSALGLSTLSSQQSEEIVGFVRTLHESDSDYDLTVHCYAGISRSAAVGKFINDTLDLRLPQYERLAVYNRQVYTSLRRVWFSGEDCYGE